MLQILEISTSLIGHLTRMQALPYLLPNTLQGQSTQTEVFSHFSVQFSTIVVLQAKLSSDISHSVLIDSQWLLSLQNKTVLLHWEAAWQSGLGRWIWNLEVPGSNPPPCCYLELLSVVPSSTPLPRCVNSQLVSLPPVGILNRLCSIYIVCLLIYGVPN